MKTQSGTLVGRGLLLAVIGSLELLRFSAHADAVGINFVGGSTVNGMPAPLGKDETAGFVPQRFWNNAPDAAGSLSPQGDGGGGLAVTYSGFNVTWSDNFGIRSTPIADTGGNSRLMKGYLNADDTPSGRITVTVSGVPAAFTRDGYAVIVYCDGDNRSANRVGKFTLVATNYGTKTIYVLDKADVDFAGVFQPVPAGSVSDRGGATPAGNVVIFAGLRDENFRLEVNGASTGDANSRAALNGLQIVDMAALPTPPEPVITSPETATGQVGVAFGYQITAENRPTGFGAADLPPGLSVNPTTGLISGIPEAAGTFHVTITAVNAAGSASRVLVLTIRPSDFTTERVETGVTNRLTQVALLDPERGGVVGEYGLVLLTRDGGVTWVRSAPGVTNHLRAIRFIGPWVFIAGDDGLICGSPDGGQTWRCVGVTTNANFYALAFLHPFLGFAAGTGGTIYRYDGENWAPVESGTTADFQAVTAVGSTAYAVGTGGTICRWDGARWTVQVSGVPEVTLYDVAFVDETFGYAVGSAGTILRTTDGGRTWVPLASGVEVTLRGIRVGDARTAWVVGDDGVVLVTSDAGATWTRVSLGFAGDFLSLDFLYGRGLSLGEGGVCLRFGYRGFELNLPPSVRLVGLAEGAVFSPCLEIPLAAEATDPDGFVTKVEFFLGPTLLGEARQAPFRGPWHSDRLGQHTFLARATDNWGAVSYSAPVAITVAPPDRVELHEPAACPPDDFRFCLTGPTGAYLIERSTDLQSWQDWTTVTNEVGFVHVTDTGRSPNVRRFYRARQLW